MPWRLCAAGHVGAGGTWPRPFDVDLQAAPFNLDEDAVAWVEFTLAGMSWTSTD